MTRRLSIFVAGLMAGLAVLAAAYYVRGENYGLLCVATAGAICGVPALASLALALWSKNRSGSEQLMAVLGGMAVRMGVVSAVSLLVFLTIPQFRETKERELMFWSAVLICYLGTLAWETVLVARHNATAVEAGGRP